MADVKDPKISEAYDKVRDDKDDLTWLLLDYEVGPRQVQSSSQSDKSDALKVSATGSGDLAEFTSNLQPQRASFGYVRVKYANDDHSFREKFCLVIWIGEEVKTMRRAKVSVHTSDVKSVLRTYSIEVSASTTGDLKEVSRYVHKQARKSSPAAVKGGPVDI